MAITDPGHPGIQAIGNGPNQVIWTYPNQSSYPQQAILGIPVYLMDVSGKLISFNVDPSMANLITIINTTHAKKYGIPAPYNNPPNNVASKSLPETDFTLDELAKAEELMEELSAH